jgi:DNA polymerase III delta subunit
MQIKPDQLPAQLERGIKPLYAVHGDEPLLAQEAADAIRAAARRTGCSEREVFNVGGAHFDWSGVLGAAQEMSLFADAKIIEIRIPSGKPGKDGSEALQRYCERLPEGVVTLVMLPRLHSTAPGSRYASIRSSVPRCRPGSRKDWRARASACARARKASAPSRSSPIASKATCSPRTRKSRNSPCCIRRAN